MKPFRWVGLLLLAGSVSSCITSPSRPGSKAAAPLLDSVEEIQQALLTWDLDELTNAAHQLSRHADEDPQAAYWQGVALFHATIALNEAEAPPARIEAALAEAVKTLKANLERQPEDSDSHAMLATLYGLAIQRHRIRGLQLGPLLLHHQRQAAVDRDANPRVNYLYGVGQLNRKRYPEALEALLRADD
ncbi:MAG: hypothetical protein AAF492_15645, partial [Verrucomicrobiota bacterium]